MAFPQQTPSSASVTVDITPLTDADIAQFRAFAPAGEAATTFFAVIAQLDVTNLMPASDVQTTAAQALVTQGLIEPHATTPGAFTMAALGYILMWAMLAQEAETNPSPITTDEQRGLVESWMAALNHQLAATWGEHLANQILRTILLYFCMLVFGSTELAATGLTLVSQGSTTQS